MEEPRVRNLSSSSDKPQSFRDKLLMHKSVMFIVISQIIFFIFFGAFAGYDEHAKPTCKTVNCTKGEDHHGEAHGETHGEDTGLHPTVRDYALFQDVHVMIFVGFGFLMTFLKRYAYSAVSINLLLAAYVIQWHTIFLGFFEISSGSGKPEFHIGLEQMFLSEFCAGAVLISMGAVLGKMSPIQYLVMAFVETMFYVFNEYLIFEVFHANDIGGSMNLHTFGAYFGLSVAWVIRDIKAVEGNRNEGTVYYSNIFSIIGALFLWMYWPSFNGGIASTDDARLRAIINTYFSLAACTLSTFAFSAMFHRNTQFDMDLIQNATLAGGVAIGSAANCLVTPFGATIVGAIAGIISVTGFHYLQPFLLKKLSLHDTCGVHNLHGMPGLFGGLVSVIMAAMATREQYGDSFASIFPGMDPDNHEVKVLPHRSAGQQAGVQILAVVFSLMFAIVGGIITGFLLKFRMCDNIVEPDQLFNDDAFFEVTEDFAEMGAIIRDASFQSLEKMAKKRASEVGLGSYNGNSDKLISQDPDTGTEGVRFHLRGSERSNL